MTLRLNTELFLSLDEAERLRRMIRRSEVGGDLEVRLRIDPLSPSVIDAVLVEGDTSQVLLSAEIDEEADTILLVVRPYEPDDAPQARWRHRASALIYPEPLTIAIDEESGGIIVRSLPDVNAYGVH